MGKIKTVKPKRVHPCAQKIENQLEHANLWQYAAYYMLI